MSKGFGDKFRGRLINTPEALRENVEKAKDDYYKETGRRISNEDLAEMISISEIKLNDLERAAYPELFKSLNEQIDDGEGGTIVRSATIEDDTFLNPLDKLELKEELEIKLSKTKDKRKIAVLNEKLARLELETKSI